MPFGYRRTPLRAPVDKEGTGAAAKPDDDAAAADAALDERIGKLVSAHVGKVLNGAINTRLSRFEERIIKSLGDRQAKPDDGEGGEGEQPAEGKGKAPAAKPPADDVNSPMAKRLAAMEKDMLEAKKAAEAERAKYQRAQEDDALKSALRSAGISSEVRVDAAMAYLRSKNAVRRDDSGNVTFAIAKDGFEDLVPISDGIAGWAKSDAGKEFVPAAGVAGSGGKSPSTPGAPTTGNGTPSRAEAGAAILRSLSQAMGGSLPPSGS